MQSYPRQFRGKNFNLNIVSVKMLRMNLRMYKAKKREKVLREQENFINKYFHVFKFCR